MVSLVFSNCISFINFPSVLQALNKAVRGILNKLTPEKFPTLVEKINSLQIDNSSRLEGVIDLVFQKVS